MEISGGGMRDGIITLTIPDAHELHACYMPFINRGGLFIPTRKQFVLGDEVFVVLDLFGEAEKIPLAGTVVWITPAGVVTSRKQGIGIQLNADAGPLVAKIETLLVDLLTTDRLTHSL